MSNSRHLQSSRGIRSSSAIRSTVNEVTALIALKKCDSASLAMKNSPIPTHSTSLYAIATPIKLSSST